MEKKDNFHVVNEKEIMEFYNLKGIFGKFRLRSKFLKSWILHSLAFSSPLSNWIILMQRSRGVKIGKNCYFSPYVQLDLLYPQLITIEDNVGIGSNSMIFVHSNPTANLYLKSHGNSTRNHYHIRSDYWEKFNDNDWKCNWKRCTR